MNRPVIVSAARTPVGKFNRSLSSIPATKLGSIVVREVVRRANIEPKDVEEVIMGCVLQAGLGQAPARQAALYGGLPYEVAAVTINKVCGSGLKAITLAAQAIKAGDFEVIVAGGMENMSQAPYLLKRARQGYVYGNDILYDALEYDGLIDPYHNIIMGETGEIVAERHNITREEADRFALWSHQKAVAAQKAGKFDEEIVPVTVEEKGETITLLDKDESPRPNTSFEKLQKLKPVFRKNGIVTAGNASPLNDGAAAVLVMSEKKAQEYGLEPMAYIGPYNTAGVEPRLVMEAPIVGVKKLFEKYNYKIDDFDLIEHNEAFATASIAVQRSLGIPDEIFNVNGGAVALGHPLGASGARIAVTLIYEMIRRDATRGLETICLGGGNAVTAVFER